jgi:hypothetical protein
MPDPHTKFRIVLKKPRPDTARRAITIAFDGACLGNPGPGGYGAVLIHDATGKEKIVRGGDPATTNNRMELTAAIEALNALRPGASVTMIGDSQYVLKGMTEWLPGWKARGWRTAQRKPVLNVELRAGSGFLNGLDKWGFCLTAARMAAEQERR